MSDEDYIDRSLKLAEKGASWTFPNPMVGAVIVKDGKIVGWGFHKRFGADHAEIEALKKAGTASKGATLYLNLEPCCHFGKTPPCSEAIIKAGISKVVCSSYDPNPKVNGHGAEILKKSGIEVLVGVLEEKAKKLNEAFFTFYTKDRPLIAIKYAASLDGKIATKTGDSKWITNKKAREYARGLRANYQAVLVGINTVIKDNPHLGARTSGKKDPLRIILDSKLRIPLNAPILRDSNVLIATTLGASRQKKKILYDKGIKLIEFDSPKVPIRKLISKLKSMEILSILVEGGGKVLGSFVDERLVDRVYVFLSPVIIGGENAKSAVLGKGVNKLSKALKLKNISLKKFEDNLLVSGSIW